MAQLRPDPVLAKILYQLMKTNKDRQQKADKRPNDRQIEEWKSTYVKGSIR